MKFKSQFVMKSSPDFNAEYFLDPISLNVETHGNFAAQVGEISASVGSIPVKMVIPFLRRKTTLLTVASIGGFEIRINPLELQIKEASIRAQGTLGTQGLRGRMNGKVGCQTEMNAAGEIYTHPAGIKIQFEPEEQYTKTE